MSKYLSFIIMKKLHAKAPNSHLFTEEDFHLCELTQTFSVSNIWLEKGMQNQIATYDLMIRDLPKNRSFFVASGLEELVSHVLKNHYSKEDIQYLQKLKVITPKFAKYLKNFKFSGDIWAMPEGTIFFPGEPIVRITGPIIEGNLMTILLINSIVSNTIFTSKVIRPLLAAKGKLVIGPGMLRAQSFESGMKASRASYICGLMQNLMALHRKYNLRQSEPMAYSYHAFMKSFDSEIEAMRAMTDIFPAAYFMVDTYDFDEGLKNAIRVAKELEQRGERLAGITIDSGDLVALSKKVRRELDRHDLQYVKISVASNLDEYKIAKMMKQGIAADSFLCSTEMITVTDEPKLEAIFKLAEIRDGKKIKQMAKLTPGKLSLPGRKQVYRIYDKKGKFKKDIIGLENEKNGGVPLLLPIIRKGKVTYKFPTLDGIALYVKSQIQKLPENLLDVTKTNPYEVKISQGILKVLEGLRKKHQSQHR